MGVLFLYTSLLIVGPVVLPGRTDIPVRQESGGACPLRSDGPAFKASAGFGHRHLDKGFRAGLAKRGSSEQIILGQTWGARGSEVAPGLDVSWKEPTHNGPSNWEDGQR